ncbi:MAG: transketolase family protein, partial [Oscillospiraceae bacterium]|nr:transketolase family protein [Oscillospiraceae bacterium]
MEMRAVYAACLAELMEKDRHVVILDADLGKASGTLSLRKKFPEQSFDCGVAEQNMASIAAGLSSYGFKPWIESFTPFATRRICDQMAISISYAKRNVKIVGTDPGIAAELNGGTHMSMEDIGEVRSIPGMVIFEPVDEVQLRAAMPVLNDYDGPVYIRLFRKEQPVVFPENYQFDLFKADVMKEGRDLSIFVSGMM